MPAFGHQRDALARVLPWVSGMVARGGRATAYVCRHFACQAPVHTPEALLAQL